MRLWRITFHIIVNIRKILMFIQRYVSFFVRRLLISLTVVTFKFLFNGLKKDPFKVQKTYIRQIGFIAFGKIL